MPAVEALGSTEYRVTGQTSLPALPIMVAGEQDGRAVVASSNHQVNRSEAVVNATVNAKAGDAVAVTFKVSSEATFDLMQIRVNGETVKCFGGERDWTTYAYAFDADGEYTVSVAYCKDEASEDGEDTLWIDTIELLSGDAAAAAVDANPTYLFGDATTLTVTVTCLMCVAAWFGLRGRYWP